MKHLFSNLTPPEKPSDILEWMEENIFICGNNSFRRESRPWLNEPIQRCFDSETRRVTFIKPVQVGGSTAGQLVICAWSRFGFGEISYNWQDDEKAEDEWQKDMLPTLERCKDLQWRGGRFDRVKCHAEFVNTYLNAQGVRQASHLDSDTIPFQINEELHLWKPGHLSKARRRQTAVFQPKALDVSNAGYARPKEARYTDQSFELHEAFLEGTQQEWEVKCPGCGLYHRMRSRWEEKKPELGGLRYDTAGCKRPDGTFNYTKLLSTIRYQMPCGFEVRESDSRTRRALSESGRYSEPREESFIPYRSYTLEAVSCHHIKWLELIQEKHIALRARMHGDKEPWRRYVTERECKFYSEDEAPLQGIVIVSQKIKKDREGLKKHPQFATRLATFDKQRGYKSKGELSHYWLVIEDVLLNCNSQIVFEGIIQTDSELIAVLDQHEVPHNCCFGDASWDTKAVLEFCYRNGVNAVMGNLSKKGFFTHGDGTRRFYSEEKAVHEELNMPPRFNYSPKKDGWQMDNQEPVVLFYNKAGLLSNHFFIRDHKTTVLANNPDADELSYIQRDIPNDVSQDFIEQCESWEKVSVNNTRTNDDVEGFRKIRHADHMLMCLAYLDMLKDWSGILGDRLARLGLKEETKNECA